jgi:hypothetical protein
MNESLNRFAQYIDMTAIPHATKALTGAFDRLERASQSMLGTVNVAVGDLGAAMADMRAAKIQAKVAVAVIRFADEMWGELLNLQAARD